MHLKVIVLWLLIAVGGAGVALSSTIIPSPSINYVRSVDVREQIRSSEIPADLPTAPEIDADTILNPSKLTSDVLVTEPVRTRIIEVIERVIPPARLTEAPVKPVSHEGSGFPVRLTIPKIGVNAAVVYVGIAPDGSMDIPKGPADVAWFNLGPRPGNEGSAVISGHYGWKDDIPAVFDDLHVLREGDKLYVEDGQGVTTTFVVREVTTYSEYQDATDIFVSTDGKAHLNLITCGGVWNKDRKSYSERTIVFTDKES
jgi:LPXTG-site transpeptidase (sortase) family protein